MRNIVRTLEKMNVNLAAKLDGVQSAIEGQMPQLPFGVVANASEGAGESGLYFVQDKGEVWEFDANTGYWMSPWRHTMMSKGALVLGQSLAAQDNWLYWQKGNGFGLTDVILGTLVVRVTPVGPNNPSDHWRLELTNGIGNANYVLWSSLTDFIVEGTDTVIRYTLDLESQSFIRLHAESVGSPGACWFSAGFNYRDIEFT